MKNKIPKDISFLLFLLQKMISDEITNSLSFFFWLGKTKFDTFRAHYILIIGTFS